ncbi:hypothetical protein Tco_1068264 [Tanacetum coccineum]|uniref:Retrotransposon gag domain-containing protein n=1 Tax=Tanacetum coccineum TaxID=301880 RepID=A0ABQ5HGZ7_9ASTR
MRELREDTFSGHKNDDAHKHVERVLDIVSLFNIPSVSHDVVMLRVFPITLTGATKRWVDRLSPGTVDSWDLLKKSFIQRENGTTTRVVSRSIFSCRSLAPENDTTVPYTLRSPAFVEANYETLESLLRDRRRKMRNNDLQTELEYFSEDYDEEREMKPRLEPIRATTPPLRAASPRVRRRRERVVGFEET